MDATHSTQSWWLPGKKIAILILLGTAGLGAVGYFATSRTRRVSRQIEAFNGLVTLRYNIDPGWLGARLQFGPMDNVYFLGPQLDDDKLAILDGVPELRVLTLTNTRVTDQGLARLARFRNLNCLYLGNIDHTKIVGAEAAKRIAAPALLGGRGLAALKDLPNLQVVQLYGAKTKDEDLKGIEPLKSLMLLDLMGTSVTDDGVARLKKALPGCKIRRR